MKGRNGAPFHFSYMASSAESNASKKFIDKQRLIYKKDLYIKKMPSTIAIGEPDIYAIFQGMPLHAESKFINPISLTNTHEFNEIQIENLAIKARAGAMCIGLLLHEKTIKFIPYDKLHAHITKEEFLNAEEFNWQKLKSLWMQNIQKNF